MAFVSGDQGDNIQVPGPYQGEGGQPHGGDWRDPHKGQQVGRL